MKIYLLFSYLYLSQCVTDGCLLFIHFLHMILLFLLSMNVFVCRWFRRKLFLFRDCVIGFVFFGHSLKTLFKVMILMAIILSHARPPPQPTITIIFIIIEFIVWLHDTPNVSNSGCIRDMLSAFFFLCQSRKYFHY